MPADNVLDRFAHRWLYCWACGISPRFEGDPLIDYPRKLEIHHIAKMGRLHEDWNLSRLCKLCHDLAEGHLVRCNGELLQTLKPKHVFWLKSRIDPRHYDRSRIVEQWRVGRPEKAERPPQWFCRQWERWRGQPYPEPERKRANNCTE